MQGILGKFSLVQMVYQVTFGFMSLIKHAVDVMSQEALSKCFSSSKTSRISLIDLAGADRNKIDDVGRKSVKEGKYVKKSLAQLGYDDALSQNMDIFLLKHII